MLEQEDPAATILIVEDNSSARMALEALLEALGYRVLATGEAAEAQAVFQSYALEIDLVMSDLILPQMGGPELCSKLREANPHLPCVIMSGYPLEDESERLQRMGITHWLQKPFNMRQLDELLRTLLSD